MLPEEELAMLPLLLPNLPEEAVGAAGGEEMHSLDVVAPLLFGPHRMSSLERRIPLGELLAKA